MQEWLNAVIAVAREAALEEDRERMGWDPRDERVPPFCYRWEHVQQVVRNALWLVGQEEEADEAIVLASCWLHDVKKRQDNHAERGAEFAREFLPRTTFPREKIEAVAHAIAVHAGLFRPAEDWRKESGAPFRPAPPLQSVEAAIVWDADKLAKIGPVALLHYIPYELTNALRRAETVTTGEMHERNRQWLETVAPRMLASFNTEAARLKALHLHSAYEMFSKMTDEALSFNE